MFDFGYHAITVVGADWWASSAPAEWSLAVAALGGVIYAGRQLNEGRRANAALVRDAESDRQVEEHARRVGRAIELHRDLTTGEVGAARDRLTTLLWQAGEERYRRNVCSRLSSFGDLLPPDGNVCQYTEAVHGWKMSEPMRDLFKVLWCFERIEATRTGGGLDDPMLVKLIGHHVMWWNELLRNVTEDDVRSRYAVRELADWVATQDRDLSAWAKADFPALDEEQSVRG